MLREVAQPAWGLVLGGAGCLWDDLEALEEGLLGGPWPGRVVAVNDAGYAWPHAFDGWATLHPDKYPEWEARRRAAGYPAGYDRWNRRETVHTDRLLDWWDGGSSGKYGVTVAAEGYGCTAVVLAGVPMTPTGYFHTNGRWGAGVWGAADRFWNSWLRTEHKQRGLVKSMSGRTREHYGAPTLAWLQERAGLYVPRHLA